MGTRSVFCGFWLDEAQDEADDFLQGFVADYRDALNRDPNWWDLCASVYSSASDFGVADATNLDGGTVLPGASEQADRFLIRLAEKFRVGVGRDPTWAEVTFHLAISARSESLEEIPEELGYLNFDSEDGGVCYVCGQVGAREDLVCMNRDPKVEVHHHCLCPERATEITIELDEETYHRVVAWSLEVNLPIGLVIRRAMWWALSDGQTNS
jgi:hypothetical protein